MHKDRYFKDQFGWYWKLDENAVWYWWLDGQKDFVKCNYEPRNFGKENNGIVELTKEEFFIEML